MGEWWLQRKPWVSSDFGVSCHWLAALYGSGTICETGKTDETVKCCCYEAQILTYLTGLTGLPPFPLSLQKSDFEAGPNKLTHYANCQTLN